MKTTITTKATKATFHQLLTDQTLMEGFWDEITKQQQQHKNKLGLYWAKLSTNWNWNFMTKLQYHS